MSWFIGRTPFTGTVVTIGTGKDYESLQLAVVAGNSAGVDCLYLLDPDLGYSLVNIAVTHKCYLKGLGALATDTAISNNCRFSNDFILENIQISRNYDGWSSSVEMDGGCSNFVVNKCKLGRDELTIVYAIGSYSGDTLTPTGLIRNSTLLGAVYYELYYQLVHLGLTTISLEKVDYNLSLNPMYCSGSFLVNDSAIIGTSGYGYAAAGNDYITYGIGHVISGTVSGVIVEGLTVNLTGDIAATATTDENGDYSFADLPDGDYTIAVDAESGYTFTPASISTTLDGADSTGNDFVSQFITLAAPTNVTASKDSSTSVTVTWDKSAGATGYRVYRDDVDVSGLLADVDTYDDTTAAAPVITPGSTAASDNLYTDRVALSLSGTSIANGTAHTYKVTAETGPAKSPASDTDTGYRLAEALSYQWQHTNVGNQIDYYDITDATTVAYDYTAAPTSRDPGNTSHGTSLYYRCKIDAAGSTQQISTPDSGYRRILPLVSTQPATNTAFSTTTGNGTIIGTGYLNAPCTRRGFCLLAGKTGNPTIADLVFAESGSFAAGQFSLDITGLIPDTDYRLAAFAQNAIGESYGETVDLKTTYLMADPLYICRGCKKIILIDPAMYENPDICPHCGASLTESQINY